ncbi:prevent-host-death family protein [Planococcus antarcticus DSM 14505]|uniref:Antitoxin n=1 Tax=Planococcus antarcticus DSM 14505 TaxID=1185653 RepID=A0AA87IIX3_9BACL|nr:prevent-host-death family protein [Planococcus antarcticus DSM 14505]
MGFEEFLVWVIRLQDYMNKVTDDFETIVITQKNVVMISAEEYNNLMGNLHFLDNETNRKHLMEFKKIGGRLVRFTEPFGC